MKAPLKLLKFPIAPTLSPPSNFTFPFYYNPHPLSKIAAEELQAYLITQTDFHHNFGLKNEQEGLVIGKMFGVLVVRCHNGELGYLAAFSGKLAGKNHHEHFVPPVFDILSEESFFLKEEESINSLNRIIETLEANPEIADLQNQIRSKQGLFDHRIQSLKFQIKEAKITRKVIRETNASLPAEALKNLLNGLNRQSQEEQLQLKLLKKEKTARIFLLQEQLNLLLSEINELKEKRKNKSAALQQKIFEKYTFLNISQKTKSLHAIFLHTADKKPPAGAGECAAPKLLQYAFLHKLTPVCMAEFWWGASPASEIKLHGNYYPACRGKCEPILNHMLEGIETDPNPMLENPAVGKELEIVYEDDVLLVINKPAEFLSVPGKTISDSVYSRISKKFPEFTGPLIVHRLDMSTSGIMLLAKNKDVHRYLQRQFIKRTVKKRYLAILEGIIEKENGVIDLPLRVDLNDRPRQLVCYEHGKTARTEWKKIKQVENKTYIYFYPVTGRTHQLRVHAAHYMGLNTPIAGDDLYGTKGERLFLHAEYIEFIHPVSKKMMSIEIKADF